MAIEIGKNGANGVVLGTTETTLYTAPGNVDRAIVSQAALHNYGTVPQTVTIYVLQSGETSASSFKRIVRTIAVDETYLCPELIGESLGASGKITGLTTSATSVSFSITMTNITS
jgi:hypothetical protein